MRPWRARRCRRSRQTTSLSTYRCLSAARCPKTGTDGAYIGRPATAPWLTHQHKWSGVAAIEVVGRILDALPNAGCRELRVPRTQLVGIGPVAASGPSGDAPGRSRNTSNRLDHRRALCGRNARSTGDNTPYEARPTAEQGRQQPRFAPVLSERHGELFVNIDDRIERRLGYDAGAGVLVDLNAVSPISHPELPGVRGPAFERLLDAFSPAFSESLPPSSYIHGPKGSGKSAIVSALFERLAAHSGPRRAIQTSTRAVEPTLPGFVYVDARQASTRFRLYHDVLADISDDSVPEHGISTDELMTSLRDGISTGPDIVVAVDHVNEPETADAATVAEWLTDVSGHIVLVCLGREPPEAIEWDPDASIAFEPYRRHVLVELLTSRCSTGLGRDALTHDQIRELAEWADGDAHDALAAITGAAISAERAGASTIRPADLDAGIDAVPKPCVALGRVLALSESRRRLLYELVSLPEADRASVSVATETIASQPAVDLSPSTVRRVLYELADAGLLDRVTAAQSGGQGRPPSRLVLRFPTLVFRELFDRPSWSI